MESIESSFTTASAIMFLLGIETQSDKAQGPPKPKEPKAPIRQGEEWFVHEDPADTDEPEPWTKPELLGVVFDLDRFEAQIKPKRRTALLEQIDAILKSELLTSGQASKLKGKLLFTTCSLFGRVGRAFIRPLSLIHI